MYYHSNNEAKQKYLSKIALKPVLALGRNRDILNAALSFFRNDSYDYVNFIRKQNELYYALWTEDKQKMADIFSGSEYKVLVTLLGKEWAERFKKIWDKSSDYTYASGMERRSFRAKSYDVLYLSSAVSKLDAMIDLAANSFSYERYFTEKENAFAHNPVIPDLFALEIDEGNEAVMHRIHDIVYGDNNTGLITREIIKGLLMSHSNEAHKWVGDLLLAARLQEGLRQTIVECMDEGSRDGFLYILRVILDHDLIRFSSVVRALDVWTGLAISAQKPAVIKKCLDTGYKCLTESGYEDECLKSSDAMLIFMGLWSVAFDDVMMTESKIKTLLSAPEKYKRMTALSFLSQTQFPWYQHQLALPLLDDPEDEVKCWALRNLFSDVNYISLRPEFGDVLAKYKRTESRCSSEELFYKLKNMLDQMPRKEIVFKESVFPWWQISVTCNDIIVKMLLAITGNAPDNMVDLMLDYRDKMSADTRREFVNRLLMKPQTNKQKTAIIELLGDKSSYVRAVAWEMVKKLRLSPDDYKIIEDILKYKAGDLRKNAISVLLCQPPEAVLRSVERLADDKNENKHLAALDMISAMENNPRFEHILPECRQMVAALSDTSQKTRVLAEKIANTEGPVFTLKNGLGLYNPKQAVSLPEVPLPKSFSPKDIFTSNINEIKMILMSFSNLIDQYKAYEYEAEDWNGAYRKVVLGGEYNIRTITSRFHREQAPTLDDYPLPEVWREAAKEYHLTAKKLLEILFYYSFKGASPFSEKQGWYDTLISGLFPVKHKEFKNILKDLPYAAHMHSIFEALLNECPKSEVFSLCRDMSCYIYHKIPSNRFAEDYEKRDQRVVYYSGGCFTCFVDADEISFWHRKMRTYLYHDESFKEFFLIGYAFYKAAEFKSHGCLQLADFERAFGMGMVDENELYAELCGRPKSAQNLRSLTDAELYDHKYVSSCEKLNEVCRKAVDRIVTIELKRGDMTTEVSDLASRIYKCYGTRFFVDILVGAEKDTYVRGYNFVGNDSTKRQIFSHLLKSCYPADGEDENTLGDFLQRLQVTEKQLIDAAMYSPQWIDIVEEYLNWPGLKSACWYFHAHVNETFSHEKETIVARFSPVSPQDFKNGAFDINWFNEAYSMLGEKRFKVVYDSAKYIAGGGLHKRAQLFADAVLGKIDLDQAEKMIREKRHKDYVLCYGLIPLNSDKNDLLHRYEFLHIFLKESKQFGAQRRESEGKAGSISLENLARNAGFSDVTRFTWYMETEKIRSIEPYLIPVLVGDTEIHIAIDKLGRASLVASKEGKALKDIPAKLKEHEYVKEIKGAQKSLENQYARARMALEKAMELEDRFTADELKNLSQNPVINPLIQNLIFKSDNRLGYYRDNGLAGIQNRKFDLLPEDKCQLAHPVHLYESGEWAAFQKDIYDRKIIQPFKQVFREFYRPNADELEARTVSRRYDGHQIQPNKAAVLLKGRGWTASYEQGLQKVYYKENIIAEIYAMADWFSPADVEAPTIEGVDFLDRKTGTPVPFTNVSKIIFSEIMRDIDLVVSVAHVGGVDPEASLSTMEMRTAIIAEMLRLLKITNVEMKGSHAFINGTLGQYTVHLGSGVAHKMAGGDLNILPIHAQHRGRIFLPFVDDDPKTAEILSKIILLSEDNKIKDPTVLVQIVD
ncbi:DUF4132 domain-containing protein [Candidatus Formimonas warabiya]|uniref:DUF4132 domain-containing protein n=1 Tax=Formimonas warabiya TaxID=1761012 RepID=A0A3G1KSL7_FORW1|nr:DUF4132 domain-containing protein [Candidatus Formimonas warabiya]ATW25426.1 hypothetical protein DCMF_12155 [Candidatus Formimonas warabiya]